MKVGVGLRAIAMVLPCLASPQVSLPQRTARVRGAFLAHFLLSILCLANAYLLLGAARDADYDEPSSAHR
jgi:hypothetical protein